MFCCLSGSTVEGGECSICCSHGFSCEEVMEFFLNWWLWDLDLSHLTVLQICFCVSESEALDVITKLFHQAWSLTVYFLLEESGNRWAVSLWLVVNYRSWSLNSYLHLDFSLNRREDNWDFSFLCGTSEFSRNKALIPSPPKEAMTPWASLGKLGELKLEFLDASLVDSSGCIYIFLFLNHVDSRRPKVEGT